MHIYNIHEMYDQQTLSIMKMVLEKSSSCVDVGAHAGAILAEIVAMCPEGKHYAFEPIPYMYEGLKSNEAFKNVALYDCALSDDRGNATFYLVENDPAYSGLKERSYNRPDPRIKEITVEKMRLDDIISTDKKIDFIKIDVEGAEMRVMRGAYRIIREQKPYIIFESGLGATDHYGESGASIHAFLVEECALELNTLDGFLTGTEGLTAEAFINIFNTTERYYFIAHRPLQMKERMQHFRNFVVDVDSRLFSQRNVQERIVRLENHVETNLPEVQVSDWGAKETHEGQGINVQPDGSSAIWIRAANVSELNDVYVYFGGQRAVDRATVSANLVTTIVPADVIGTPGKYEVVIVESFGRRTTVGTFHVKPNRPWKWDKTLSFRRQN